MRFRQGLVLAVLILPFGLLPASAQALVADTPDTPAPVPNTAVLAIARGNGLTYIGGDFTSIHSYTGASARLDQVSGKVNGRFPDVRGGTADVFASAPDGAGGFYIGGDFTTVGDVTRNNIAHVLADGSVDPAFNPNATGDVRALAVSSGAVFAGGDFTTIGGLARNRIAKLSAASGNAFSAWNPDANGAGETVRALAVSGSSIFVGGDFVNIGGAARNGLAKLSVTSGNAFSGWNPAEAGVVVDALAVTGSEVYAGGSFGELGGQTRLNIAKLSATSGNAFSAWHPDAVNAGGSTKVRALALDGSAIYAGGLFTTIGGQLRNKIAKLSTTSGNAFSGFNPNAQPLGGQVFGLAVAGSSVYAGGTFTSIGNSGAAGSRNRLARLSATSGNAFASFNPDPNGSLVSTLAVSGSSVLVGGDFDRSNAVARNRIAALDANGNPTAFNPDADDQVRALAVSGNEVYAGGLFDNIGGEARSRIAKLSAASGNAFSAWDPNPTGANDRAVRQLAVSGGSLYVGGSGFTNIGGQPRTNLAKLSTTSGNAFSGFDPNPNDAVQALAVVGGAVYAGGSFTQIDGQVHNRLAKVSATDGDLFTAFDPEPNGLVNALAIASDSLYVGADNMTTIGGQTRNGIAKVSATSGDADAGFDADPSGGPSPSGVVRAIALAGGVVYAGGNFTMMGPDARESLAALSATSGDAFSLFNPDFSQFVADLLIDGQTLYAAGSFSGVGGRPIAFYSEFTEP